MAEAASDSDGMAEAELAQNGRLIVDMNEGSGPCGNWRRGDLAWPLGRTQVGHTPRQRQKPIAEAEATEARTIQSPGHGSFPFLDRERDCFWSFCLLPCLIHQI